MKQDIVCACAGDGDARSIAIKLALTAGLAAGYLWFAILFGYSGFAGTGSDVPFIAGGLALVVLAIVILFR